MRCCYQKTSIFGATSFLGFIWIIRTGVGDWLGSRIPACLAQDFAVPIAFIAPTLRTAPKVVAAFTALPGYH